MARPLSAMLCAGVLGLTGVLGHSVLERPPADALFRRADAPVNDRVADLLARMSLEEKVAQLLNPWPTKYNCVDLIRDFGKTGVGAVYAYSIDDCGHGLSHVDALNYLQATFVNSSRLGIPIAMISETLHSSVQGGTAFPNPTLLGQSFNASLVEAIGSVIAAEARANGVTRGFAPVLQVVVDPRFGRYEEAFGEDPHLVGVLGAAMVAGQQGTGGPHTYLEDTAHVSCEAKHAVAYAVSGRDWYRADISTRTLMDVYVKPWRAAIEGGLRGLMVTHPEVAGLPMHGNGPILAGVLRGVLGGEELFFASDAGDVEAIASHGVTTNVNESAIYALTASLDQELVTTCYPTLVDSVNRGLVDVKYVDASVTRILREKFALHLMDGPAWWHVDPAAAAAALVVPAHRALARDAAVQGIVMLANAPDARSPNGAGKPLLPLQGLGSTITRVAVVGPNSGCAGNATDCAATSAYRGGYSNSGAAVVTLLEALNAVPGLSVGWAEGANITDASDVSGIPAAVAAAAAAQVVIAVVGDTSSGYGKGTCAEGIDADTIDLPGSQLALLAALAAGPTPLIVVGVHGRPFTLGAGPTSPYGANNALLNHIPALLAAFRPGEEGGNAILDILSGAANPSGRLTANWVRNVGALRGPANPYFQARGAPTHAYVTEPATALWAFGSGLSYNTATIKSATLTGLPPGSAPLGGNDTFAVEGTLDNVGPAGAVILQVYFSQDAPTKWVRTSRQLVAFTRVAVPADSRGTPYSVAVNVRDMDGWDEEAGAYVVWTGNYTFNVALDSQSSAFAFNAIPVSSYAWSRPSFPGAPTR